MPRCDYLAESKGPSSSFSLGRQAKQYTLGRVDKPVLKIFAWSLGQAAFT